MKKNQLVGGAVFLVAGFLVVGCGPEIDGEGESDGLAAAEEIEEQLEKADAAGYPVGTFEKVDGPHRVGGEAYVGFEKIVLMTNKTYHTEQKVKCMVWPCPPVSKNGKYKFVRRAGKKWLNLYDSTGRLDRQIQYRLFTSNLLGLQEAGSSEGVVFGKARVAWCGKASDCKAQRLFSVLTCQGQWRCEPTNTCSFHCGR